MCFELHCLHVLNLVCSFFLYLLFSVFLIEFYFVSFSTILTCILLVYFTVRRYGGSSFVNGRARVIKMVSKFIYFYFIVFFLGESPFLVPSTVGQCNIDQRFFLLLSLTVLIPVRTPLGY